MLFFCIRKDSLDCLFAPGLDAEHVLDEGHFDEDNGIYWGDRV